MIFISLFEFLFLALALLLFIQASQSSLFFICLCQIKEYRLDRLIIHFKTVSGINQLINNFNLLKWKNFYWPRFTFRAFLMLLILFYFECRFFFIFLKLIFPFFLIIPKSVFLSVILSQSIIVFLMPFFALLTLIFTNLLFMPIKEMIYIIAKWKINKMAKLKIIGITGSYAKTSTKEILFKLLKSDFKVLKTEANCNTKLGIALTILKNLQKKHQIFICEMGAYKKGEVKEICKMVKPLVGIITGINQQHLALFGSFNNIKKAKYELIEALPKEGLAIFNIKDQPVRSLALKTKINKKNYQEAVEAGLVVAQYLGINRNKARSHLKRIREIDWGIKVLSGLNGIKVIDDSYSSNPTGFLAVLDMAKKIKAQKKILITPGIIELGSASLKVHQLIFKKALNVCQRIILTKKDLVVPLGKMFKRIKPDFALEVYEDGQELLSALENDLCKENLVILEGRMTKVPVDFKKKLLKVKYK